MRQRLLAATLCAVALGVAACGSSASGTPHSSSSSTSGVSSAKATNLGVPLPAAIKAKGQLDVGVKCDYPPFGYINAAGQNAGYEIDIIHKMAQYAFGNPKDVIFTCVTGSNRVGYLTTGKIDLIVATMSYTPQRAQVIQFSTPYFDSGVKLLVPKTSSITSWAAVKGKSVVTITGTTGSIWMTKCMPSIHQVLYKVTSNALSALQEHRGVAFAQDDTLLEDLAAKNSSLKVVGTPEASSPWGMGIRLGDTALTKWVNAALAKMQGSDYFYQTFKTVVPQQSYATAFSNYVPRPGHSLTYAKGNIYVCG